jgi:hypothetical protein
MKCPHCNTGIYLGFTDSIVVNSPAVTNLAGQAIGPPLTWRLYHQRCPECHDSIILLARSSSWSKWQDLNFMAYPRSRSRPIAKEVPDPYRLDFSEACTVLADSPKASAALSRRCLQAILKDKLGSKKRDLYDQIEEVIAAGSIPSYIAEGLHDVRNIGKFAAHPIKSTSTGAIVDVEPGEAEWNLEVVEMLFDFCFVQPALAAERKAAIEKKLEDAKKKTP